MKKFKLFALAALVAVIGFGFSFTSCNNEPEDDSKPPIVQVPQIAETPFFVSGQFEKGTGETVSFELSGSGGSRSARAVGAGSYPITGILEDGDILFRLKGTYDPVNLSYTVSAASSLIRYTINGTVNSSGSPTGSTATVAVNNGSGNWTTTTVIVNEDAEVNITATEEDFAEPITGGIPSAAHGWWKFIDDGVAANLLVSEWGINLDITYDDNSKNTQKVAVIDVAGSGSSFDVVWTYPVYNATDEQLKAAAAAFLSANSITATYLDGGNPYRDYSEELSIGTYLWMSSGWSWWGGGYYGESPDNSTPFWSEVDGFDPGNAYDNYGPTELAATPAAWHTLRAAIYEVISSTSTTDAQKISEVQTLFTNAGIADVEVISDFKWEDDPFNVGFGHKVFGFRGEFNLGMFIKRANGNWVNADNWRTATKCSTYLSGVVREAYGQPENGFESTQLSQLQAILNKKTHTLSQDDKNTIIGICNGISVLPNQVTFLDASPWSNIADTPNTPFYYIEGGQIGFGGINQTTWDKIDELWYRGNYLERYLIELNVTPSAMYQKMRFAFSNGNSRLTLTPYGVLNSGMYDTDFNTLSGANGASALANDYAITITR